MAAAAVQLPPSAHCGDCRLLLGKRRSAACRRAVRSHPGHQPAVLLLQQHVRVVHRRAPRRRHGCFGAKSRFLPFSQTPLHVHGRAAGCVGAGCGAGAGGCARRHRQARRWVFAGAGKEAAGHGPAADGPDDTAASARVRLLCTLSADMAPPTPPIPAPLQLRPSPCLARRLILCTKHRPLPCTFAGWVRPRPPPPATLNSPNCPFPRPPSLTRPGSP